jgi:hypothetical protein
MFDQVLPFRVLEPKLTKAFFCSNFSISIRHTAQRMNLRIT